MLVDVPSFLENGIANKQALENGAIYVASVDDGMVYRELITNKFFWIAGKVNELYYFPYSKDSIIEYEMGREEFTATRVIYKKKVVVVPAEEIKPIEIQPTEPIEPTTVDTTPTEQPIDSVNQIDPVKPIQPTEPVETTSVDALEESLI